jgi:two-component system, chemotaxis family, sensor kinase Cph1
MSAERPTYPERVAATSGLSPCERELIHIPGATQPNGAVLAAQADGGLVTHASANLAAILGIPAEAVLGRSLEAAVGEAVCRVWLSRGSDDGAGLGSAHLLPGPHGGKIQLRAHRSGARICVDIEPVHANPWEESPVALVQSVMETSRVQRPAVSSPNSRFAG